MRLASHDKDEAKDFWTRTAVVISKDENLTKAHGRYLESRLIEMARAADRASLANGTSPEANPLPEPDVVAQSEKPKRLTAQSRPRQPSSSPRRAGRT